jgi:hypothetical protein
MNLIIIVIHHLSRAASKICAELTEYLSKNNISKPGDFIGLKAVDKSETLLGKEFCVSKFRNDISSVQAYSIDNYAIDTIAVDAFTEMLEWICNILIEAKEQNTTLIRIYAKYSELDEDENANAKVHADITFTADELADCAKKIQAVRRRNKGLRFDGSVLFRDGTVGYTVDDAKRTLSALSGGNSDPLFDLGEKWIDARKSLISSMTKDRVFLMASTVWTYLSANFDFAREMTRRALDSEFALADSEELEKLALALAYTDCKSVNPTDGEPYIAAQMLTPTVLNSYVTICHFLAEYLGFSGEIPLKSGVRDASLLKAMDGIVDNKMKESFRLSFHYKGAEYRVDPWDNITGDALKIENRKIRLEVEYNEEGYLLVAWKRREQDSVHAVPLIPIADKVIAYSNTRKAIEQKKCKLLIIGSYNEDDRDVFKKRVENIKGVKWEIKFHVGYANWTEILDEYDLVFILDAALLYTSERRDPKEKYEYTISRYVKGAGRDMDYIGATSQYFEPLLNAWSNIADCIVGISCGAHEGSENIFVTERNVRLNTLAAVAKRIRSGITRTKQLYVYVAELSEQYEDTLLTRNFDLYRRQSCMGISITILQAFSKDLCTDMLITNNSVETFSPAVITVPAWSIAKQLSPMVWNWLCADMFETADEKDKDTVNKYKYGLIELLHNIAIRIHYSRGNDEEKRGGDLDVSYSIVLHNNLRKYADEKKEQINTVKNFLNEFLRLSYPTKFPIEVYRDYDLVRGFFHCALRNVLAAAIFGRTKYIGDMVFYELFESGSSRLPEEIEKEKKRNITDEEYVDFNADSVMYSDRRYYKKIVSMLNHQTFNYNSDAYAKQLAERAMQYEGVQKPDKNAYSIFINALVSACSGLGIYNSYIYNNARDLEGIGIGK